MPDQQSPISTGISGSFPEGLAPDETDVTSCILFWHVVLSLCHQEIGSNSSAPASRLALVICPQPREGSGRDASGFLELGKLAVCQRGQLLPWLACRIMLFKFVYENITGYIILMDRHPLWTLFVELEILMLNLAVGCLHDWCREDRELPLNSFNSVLQSNGTTSSSSHLSLQKYPNHLTKTHLNFPNIQRNHTPKDSEPAETKTLCR